MAIQSRETLKTYFETGDVPTEAEFIHLIDSALNFNDDDWEDLAGDGDITTTNGILTAINLNVSTVHEFIQTRNNVTGDNAVLRLSAHSNGTPEADFGAAILFLAERGDGSQALEQLGRIAFRLSNDTSQPGGEFVLNQNQSGVGGFVETLRYTPLCVLSLGSTDQNLTPTINAVSINGNTDLVLNSEGTGDILLNSEVAAVKIPAIVELTDGSAVTFDCGNYDMKIVKWDTAESTPTLSISNFEKLAYVNVLKTISGDSTVTIDGTGYKFVDMDNKAAPAASINMVISQAANLPFKLDFIDSGQIDSGDIVIWVTSK